MTSHSGFAARFCATIFTSTVLVFSAPAHAQGDLGESGSDWTFRVGGGLLYAPAFRGSDDYQLNGLPYLFVEYKEIFEASVQRGARYNIFRSEDFTAGPIARLDFGRREDGDNIFRIAGARSAAVQGMGDIDTTVELGGFLEYEWEPLTFSFEMRQALSGHDGFVGRAAVEYAVEFNPLGAILILLVEPEVRFAGGRFTQAYFGVTPAQSLNTGYAPYAPDGGIYSYGIGLTAILPLSRNLFVALLLNADALAGDSRNSPFVRGPGSTGQTSGGLLLAYQFGG